MADKLRMRRGNRELRGLPDKPETIPLSQAPPEAWVWVLKAGMSPETATDKYGIAWSPKYNRVIVPILEGGIDSGGFIARSVSAGVPKYLTSVSSHNHWWHSRDNGTGVLVVVEDVLSAIAIDRAGFMAISVLGTAFTNPCMARISSLCKDAIHWLDEDAGGRAGRRALLAASGKWPIRTGRRGIRTPLDPKRYSTAEIRRYIQEAINDRSSASAHTETP